MATPADAAPAAELVRLDTKDKQSLPPIQIGESSHFTKQSVFEVVGGGYEIPTVREPKKSDNGPWERAERIVAEQLRRVRRHALAKLTDTGGTMAAFHGHHCPTCRGRGVWSDADRGVICKRCGEKCSDCGVRGRWDELAQAIVCPECGQILKHRVLSKSRIPRCAQCGKETVHGNVTLAVTAEREGEQRRVGVFGLRSCNAAWRCPKCARKKQIQDATELHAVNLGFREHAKARRVYMLTLTIPHHDGQDLATLRRAVTKAYQKTHTGPPVRKMRERFGVLQTLRRIEVTHGPNGWHPHIHALVFCERELELEERASLKAWYVERWGNAVVRLELERPHHSAIAITVAKKNGDYLAKMGLFELAGEFGKIARCGNRECPLKHAKEKKKRTDHVESRWLDGVRICKHCGHEVNRTPWQILLDYSEHGEKRDKGLWLQYYDQIHGARRLTWGRWGSSLNIRALYAPPEKAELPIPKDTDQIIVKREHWLSLGIERQQSLIEAHELGDRQGADAILGPDFARWRPIVYDSTDPAPPDELEIRAEVRDELMRAGIKQPKRSRGVYVWTPKEQRIQA